MRKSLVKSAPRTYTKKSTWLNAKNVSISIQDYWALAPRDRPRTYEGLLKKMHRKAGIWCIKQTNTETGEIEHLQICENTLTDNGCNSMWKNTMNYTAGGIAVANILAIDASLGIATVGAISSGGTVTSITVTALTGPTIPSGTTLLINPGGTTNKLLVSTTQAITGAQTCTVTSTTGPGSAIAAGSYARYANDIDVLGTALSSMPTTDVSALTAPISYTAALPTGQFTAPTGTGKGNRKMQVTTAGNYTFQTTANSNSSTATVGTYTSFWLVNANPVAATTNTFVHGVLNAPLAISSGLTIDVTCSESL